MKVGFDGKRALNNNSGLGNYSRFVLEAVSRLTDHQLYVYTPKAQAKHEKVLSLLSGLVFRFPSFRNKFYAMWWRTFGISKELLKDGVEVFHGLSNELPVGLASHIRKVVTIHDLIFLRYPELYKPLDRNIYTRKFHKAAIEADVIIAISEQTKRDLIDFFGIASSKVEVVYQDCDVQFHRVLPHSELKEVQTKYQLPDEFLLCVGTIEPRKNQRIILAALQELKKVKLVLVGRKTPYQEELMIFITENGLTDRVQFINNVTFSELPHIYHLSRVFVYPSIFEGFGIPIIEAQNQGVPVVTSTGSCFAETGGDAALYGDPSRADVLVKHIQQLLDDKELYESCIRLGRLNVQRFRAENTISQVQKIYKG